MTKSIQQFNDIGKNAPRPNLPFEDRDAITAVVRNSNNEYLGLQYVQIDWETFVTGGIETGQTPEGAARSEVYEETGYFNLRLISELPRYDAMFYHGLKKLNRHAHFQCFLFEISETAPDTPSEEERARHEPVWLDAEKLKTFRLPEGHRYLINYIEENKL